MITAITFTAPQIDYWPSPFDQRGLRTDGRSSGSRVASVMAAVALCGAICLDNDVRPGSRPLRHSYRISCLVHNPG